MSATLVFERGAVRVYSGAGGGKYPDGNQVVVRGREALAVFDTPLVANRLAETVAAADLVILGHMHEDHAAGLHLARRARLWAHEGDVEAVRSWEGLARHYGVSEAVRAPLRAKIEREFHWVARPDALAYRDGARWELGGVTVTAVHLPGHTSGHCGLLVEPEGVFFIGDIDLSSFGPYYGDATSSLEAFRRTLVRIAEVPATAWVTSHHKGVVTERATFVALVAAFARRIEEREAAIEARLRERPATLEELVAHRFLYPRGYEELWVEDAERRTIAQHLAALEARGRVREAQGRYHAL